MVVAEVGPDRQSIEKEVDAVHQVTAPDAQSLVPEENPDPNLPTRYI